MTEKQPLNSEMPPFREKFAAGLARALVGAAHTPGAHTAIVDAHSAAEELITALALVLHGSPDYATPSSSRKHCDQLARLIQKRIAEMQRASAAGGLNFMRTVQPDEVH